MTRSDGSGRRGSNPPTTGAANDLQSTRLTLRLNQIDRVRANGIGDHISLPQLVVCGDQSSGKSSVLEGITGFPFPRKDGVCTRFATEIILRHDSAAAHISATIIPHRSRTEVEKDLFRTYRRELLDFSELPFVIQDATALMGLRGLDEATSAPAFAADILRVEVVGRTGLHLTVVDLPGLISVANDEQTDEDVELVSDLVNSYLQSPRAIILAVVQASNDIANQGIIRRARQFDANGQRTVGIITKPDLINKGTEGRIALLSKNQDTTKLKLGYFLLKNPSPLELESDITAEERKSKELAFFTRSPWVEQELDMSRVGIDALTSYLQHLLGEHVERELPKVRGEITALLEQTERQLDMIGPERPTATHLRMFLTRLSMKFLGLAQAALDGNYIGLEADLLDHDKQSGHSCRLRAEIHLLNGRFAAYMRKHGKKRRIHNTDADSPNANGGAEDGEIQVTEDRYNCWIREVYMRTRGRELPGNYNHLLLAELFHEQSSLWPEIARSHLRDVCRLVEGFVNRVLENIVDEDHVREELRHLLADKLANCNKTAGEELAIILSDEKRQPITYNHYYTDNIQKARQDTMHKSVQESMESAIAQDFCGTLHISNTVADREKFFASLKKNILVDMDAQACHEARVGLEAYYKVSMKTFVDNVCRQVIERHVLSGLAQIFSPATVIEFSDQELTRIASETQHQSDRRAKLESLVGCLRASLLELRR